MNTTTTTAWSRTVTVKNAAGTMSMQYTQFLDHRATAARLTEAIRERPGAAIRDWLDHALFGELGDMTPESDEPKAA